VLIAQLQDDAKLVPRIAFRSKLRDASTLLQPRSGIARVRSTRAHIRFYAVLWLSCWTDLPKLARTGPSRIPLPIFSLFPVSNAKRQF
jgi:hypothetical protein